PEILRWTVTPLQEALFGRMLIEPEVIRMLIFGLALVLIMLFRPAGLLPSAVRKRELAASGEAALVDARLWPPCASQRESADISAAAARSPGSRSPSRRGRSSA